MQWLEVCVDAHSSGADALCDVLDGLGVSGLVIEDEKDLLDFMESSKQYWDYIDDGFLAARKGLCRVKYYLADDEDGRETLEIQRAALEQAGYAPTVSPIRDEDWENNWKQFYRPMEVGKRLLIVPEWEEAPRAGNRTVLRLNPGLIFGTGSHPSTRMCLEAMEDLAPHADRVLDLGCGSGILAIAALVLGAKTAFGCDIDEKAPHIALENAALNGVADRLEVLSGDVLAGGPLRARLDQEKYPLIFMNIVADVIISLCGQVPRWLTAEGTFLCSGVIDGREDEVAAALKQAGLTVTGRRRLGDWYSFTARMGETT